MDASKLVKEWLTEGKTVILDRYVYSNVAFQCAKLDDEASQDRLRKWIVDLEFNYYKIPLPDLNLFLDVPFQFTKERLTEIRKGDDRDYLQGKEDIHEKDLTFQEKVRQIYLRQEKIDSYFKIVKCYNDDLSIKKPDEIYSLIIDRVGGILNL
jgi:dTMP kinase